MHALQFRVKRVASVMRTDDYQLECSSNYKSKSCCTLNLFTSQVVRGPLRLTKIPHTVGVPLSLTNIPFGDASHRNPRLLVSSSKYHDCSSLMLRILRQSRAPPLRSPTRPYGVSIAFFH